MVLSIIIRVHKDSNIRLLILLTCDTYRLIGSRVPGFGGYRLFSVFYTMANYAFMYCIGGGAPGSCIGGGALFADVHGIKSLANMLFNSVIKHRFQV